MPKYVKRIIYFRRTRYMPKAFYFGEASLERLKDPWIGKTNKQVQKRLTSRALKRAASLIIAESMEGRGLIRDVPVNGKSYNCKAYAKGPPSPWKTVSMSLSNSTLPVEPSHSTISPFTVPERFRSSSAPRFLSYQTIRFLIHLETSTP